jgi:flagellar hook-basal body complex protein FliE
MSTRMTISLFLITMASTSWVAGTRKIRIDPTTYEMKDIIAKAMRARALYLKICAKPSGSTVRLRYAKMLKDILDELDDNEKKVEEMVRSFREEYDAGGLSRNTIGDLEGHYIFMLGELDDLQMYNMREKYSEKGELTEEIKKTAENPAIAAIEKATDAELEHYEVPGLETGRIDPTISAMKDTLHTAKRAHALYTKINTEPLNPQTEKRFVKMLKDLSQKLFKDEKKVEKTVKSFRERHWKGLSKNQIERLLDAQASMIEVLADEQAYDIINKYLFET